MLEDHCGFGALGDALLSMEGGGFRRVFVVASRSGWRRFNADGVRPFFAMREVEVFSDFNYNPDFQDIMRGAERFRHFQPDVIVAIGGGSSIDVAKVIKAEVYGKQATDPAKAAGIVVSGDGPPLVAIATTAGSGSEATQYAVFYRGDAKQSMSHPSLRPEMAVVDPELTYSMPSGQTAATGFDALSQAIEAYWATGSTEEAQDLGRAAIGYILPNLYNAVTNPGPGNRYNMAMAAYLAGKAINITRTTLAHALGYHLTKHYGLPHGHAVAMSLPYCFLINTDPALEVRNPPGAERNAENMRSLFTLLGQKDAEDSYVFWRNLMRACGLAATFREIGLVGRERMEAFVYSANPDRLNNHPMKVEPGYLINLFLTRE